MLTQSVRRLSPKAIGLWHCASFDGKSTRNCSALIPTSTALDACLPCVHTIYSAMMGCVPILAWTQTLAGPFVSLGGTMGQKS
jgi:hypothetical protein